MKERLTNQEKKSREKKQRIYRVAMKMFSEYGYEQATIRDICKAAGITTSSFYNFFGDKDGVLLQFYYEILEKGAAHLDLTPQNLQTPYPQNHVFCEHYPVLDIRLLPKLKLFEPI